MNNNNLGFMAVIIAFDIFLLSLFINATYNHSVHNLNRINETQAICLAGHNELSALAENQCADIQTKMNTEFLCTANVVGGGQCWTELK